MDSPLQLLASVSSPIDAQLFQAYLESRGIECHLFDYHLNGLEMGHGILFDVRLMVREKDMKEAVDCYKEYFKSDSREKSSMEEEDPEEIEYMEERARIKQHRDNLGAFVGWLFLGFFILVLLFVVYLVISAF